jgi:hypothetical protein
VTEVARDALVVPRAVSRARSDPLVHMVGVTVVLLPFLSPAGPGNTAPADLGMAASIGLALLWVNRELLLVKFPYAAGVALLVLGGALAATVAHAPLGVALVLAQDVFLLGWAATLALGRHNSDIVAVATHAWCRVAPVYAAVGVVSYVIGFSALSGVTATNGVRAAYTFGDPNLAGNYLVTSLFLMVACKRPRSPGVRRIGYAVVLVAMVFTGSNGAMLTLFVGAVMCFVLSQLHARGAMVGTLAMGGAVLVVAVSVLFVLPRVDLGTVREQAAGSIPLLRDSFGRSDSSAGERATIVHEGYQLFLRGDATGYGPARTKATFAATQASYVKEAHNDYLATLLERGLLGAVGLVVLWVSVGARCVRLVTSSLPAPYAAAVPRAWLLMVVAPVMATAGGFYEVLHFRHLWTWLGLVAALSAVAVVRRRGAGAGAVDASDADGGDGS